MRARINKGLVSKLTPKDRAYEVVDEDLVGLLLRVQPTGRMTYYFSYRLANGRKNRVKLGGADALTPSMARAHAKRMLAEVVHGRDPRADRGEARSLTLGEFITGRYGEWALANRKSARSALQRLEGAFGPRWDGGKLWRRPLDQVSAWDVERWRSAKVKERGHRAAGAREVAYLKAAISKAVAWELLKDSPLRGIKVPEPDNGSRVRYLDEAERKRLFDALERREEQRRQERDNHNVWLRERCLEEFPDLRELPFTDHLKPMVLLSLNTGLRRGEVFSLAWADISFDRRILTVRGGGAKSGKTRHLPVNETAFQVLNDWRDMTSGDGLVFKSPVTGGRFDNVSNGWEELRQSAGLVDFRWHDMRHDFASRLVMAGIDLNTVRELLGHADLKMTLRYAHLAPEHKAQAVAVLDGIGFTAPSQ